MDQTKDVEVGVACDIAQSIPGSTSSDSVTIDIRRLSDGYTWNFSTLAFTADANVGNMVFVSGEWWKQSFTPPAVGTYLISIANTSLDVPYYQTLLAKIPAAPQPAVISSTPLTIDERIAQCDQVLNARMSGGAVKVKEINGRKVEYISTDEIIRYRKYLVSQKTAKAYRPTLMSFDEGC